MRNFLVCLLCFTLIWVNYVSYAASEVTDTSASDSTDEDAILAEIFGSLNISTTTKSTTPPAPITGATAPTTEVTTPPVQTTKVTTSNTESTITTKKIEDEEIDFNSASVNSSDNQISWKSTNTVLVDIEDVVAKNSTLPKTWPWSILIFLISILLVPLIFFLRRKSV